MKKMKKWELLKKAYETFPAGTKFTWGGSEIVSTGVFQFASDDARKGWILDSNEMAVFDGEQWAEIIEEPKDHPKKQFIMMSKDGVRLNDGDKFYCAMFCNGPSQWILDFINDSNEFVMRSHTAAQDDFNKYFSTKEAAIKYIEEENTPKYREVHLFDGMWAKVLSGEILIKDADKNVTTLRPSDLEDMQQALRVLDKLQS